MSKFRRRGWEIGLYLVTILGCIAILFSVQATAYAQCAIDWTCQIVDSSGDVGRYTSLVFDAFGKPAISYYDWDNGDLKLAYDRNGDGNFSIADEIITVDDGNNVGWYTSLAFDSSWYLAISYLDLSNGDLKLAYDRNGNGDFSDAGEIIPVDSSGDVGKYTSIAFDAWGKLAISYYDSDKGAVKLAYDRNGDGNFSIADEIITVDNDGDVGVGTSLAFDSSGNPAISYSDETSYDTKFAHDLDGNGDFEADEIIVVDSDGNVGGYSSLAFGASGNPAISYYDYTNDDLKLARYSPTAAVIIKKTPNPTSVIEDGENVQFTINVTNSGKVNVTIESLTDSVFDLSTRCSDAAGTVLAPDERYSCNFTEFIAGSIGDSHQNTATVNASDDEGNWDTDEDTATVSFETTVQVFGVTREVNCDILPDVEIWLGGTGPVFSAGNGSYGIYAPGSGTYAISAAKEGFRDRVRTEYIEGPDPVNLNFQAAYGLIPCSPDIWYALECVNLWKYPPGTECDLDMDTVLDVVNAWLYPGCP